MSKRIAGAVVVVAMMFAAAPAGAASPVCGYDPAQCPSIVYGTNCLASGAWLGNGTDIGTSSTYASLSGPAFHPDSGAWQQQNAFGVSAQEIESDCFSEWPPTANGRSCGSASLANFSISAGGVFLRGDALKAESCSGLGTVGQFVQSSVTKLEVLSPCCITIPVSASPNTVIPLGIGTLFLNERHNVNWCPGRMGNALRLELIGGTRVVLGWVYTSACPVPQ